MWKEGIVAHLALLSHRVTSQTEENSRNRITAVICEQDLEPRPHEYWRLTFRVYSLAPALCYCVRQIHPYVRKRFTVAHQQNIVSAEIYNLYLLKVDIRRSQQHARYSMLKYFFSLSSFLTDNMVHLNYKTDFGPHFVSYIEWRRCSNISSASVRSSYYTTRSISIIKLILGLISYLT